MSDSKSQLKNTMIGVALTWLLSLGGAWVAHTNSITEIKTQQTAMMASILDMKIAHADLAEKVSENTKKGAVTTSVLERLNETLTNIDGSLDKIVLTTTKNSVEIDNLKEQLNKVE